MDEVNVYLEATGKALVLKKGHEEIEVSIEGAVQLVNKLWQVLQLKPIEKAAEPVEEPEELPEEPADLPIATEEKKELDNSASSKLAERAKRMGQKR